jgi:hypothetical protein
MEMRKLFLSALVFSLAAPAMAETAAPVNEKTIFEQSAPHMVEFLANAMQAGRKDKLQSVLSLFEQERPAVERHDVITQSVVLKAEAQQKTQSGSL